MSGIGNVYLTLENCEMADSIFRIALEEERTLDSDLGLAMNYANLGSIFEMRGMMDSAFVYYNYSMEHNRAAGSVVGISLCHNHIGRLFEKKGQWDQAIREYRNAYDLMVADNDLYHWLESCLALARVNIYKGDLRMAEAFLEHAEGAATCRGRGSICRACIIWITCVIRSWVIIRMPSTLIHQVSLMLIACEILRI